MVYVFDTAATARTAVQSILKAATSIGENIQNLRVRTGNGPQYGSREFRKSMQMLGLKHEFIWKNMPEQNGYVESFHETLKREYVLPHEFAHFQDVEVILARAFADYNEYKIHSALGYITPNEFALRSECGNK